MFRHPPRKGREKEKRRAVMKYWLVDTENVAKSWQPFAERAESGDVFILFYSKNVGPVSMSLFGPACLKGVRFEFIECRVGSNAMDFQIATELGKLVALHPDAEFIIISKDTGFNVVVEYWRRRKLNVRREGLPVPSVVPLPTLVQKPATPEQEIREKYKEMLRKAGMEDGDLCIVAAILMAAMSEPQNKRKANVFNRFQARYGAKEGLVRYTAIKALVHDIAVNGPFPPAAAKPVPPVTSTTAGPKKKLSAQVKELVPGLSAEQASLVAQAVNETTTAHGNRSMLMLKLGKKLGEDFASAHIERLAAMVG